MPSAALPFLPHSAAAFELQRLLFSATTASRKLLLSCCRVIGLFLFQLSVLNKQLSVVPNDVARECNEALLSRVLYCVALRCCQNSCDPSVGSRKLHSVSSSR